MIIMTGGTRGLGSVAAEQLKADGRRIMAVRGQGRPPTGWEPLPLDLSSLASVRTFAAALPAEPITHLILNAGGQRANASTRWLRDDLRHKSPRALLAAATDDAAPCS